jgi:flavin-dependent dehydrogenase
MTRSRDYDVAVMGGGPAGCVTAIGLVRLGHRIALVTRPRRHQAFEGLSQRTLDGLEAAGCAQALATVGAEVRRQASWAGAAAEANSEFVVARDAFDAALVADAEAAGVQIRQGRVVKAAADAGRWQLDCKGTGGGEFGLGAAFLVEARGREAPAAGVRRRRGPPTTALSRLWRMPAGAPARTAVAAFAEGWAWLAAPGDGQAILQFMVASGRGRLPPRAALTDHYAALTDALPEAADWLDGADPDGAAFARESTATMAKPIQGENWLRLGDAALAVDPLSGHGIFVAIGGALAAAPVINTLLRRPEGSDAARRLYDERAEHDFLRLCRVGRDFYRQEGRWPEGRFWRERRAWPDGEPAHVPPFSAPPEVAEVPVIEDGLVTLRDAVVTPDHPRGIWQVAGVPLVPLLRLAADKQPAPPAEIRQAAAEALGGDPAAIETALGWLHYRRLIG